MNLILIGRNVAKLKEIASDIKAEYNDVEIEVIEADFADNDDIKKTIEDGLAGKDIGVLVNNVGVILPHPMYFHEVNDNFNLSLIISPKIQLTKMLVTCQRFGDLFLFGLVWQYFSVQTKYNKGSFKVMATYL
jgi:short-subunit dehydrogenase